MLRDTLLCACEKTPVYEGQSGTLFCDTCGGIVENGTTRLRVVDGAVQDQTEGEKLFVSCEHCGDVTEYENKILIDKVLKRIDKLLSTVCPSCNKEAILDKSFRKFYKG